MLKTASTDTGEIVDCSCSFVRNRIFGNSSFKCSSFLHRRKTAPNAICTEERAAIKTVLLGCLGEPGKEVALQIAVAIGKIARFDVPREWPELLPALMAAIQNSGGNDLVQHRDESSPTQLF